MKTILALLVLATSSFSFAQGITSDRVGAAAAVDSANFAKINGVKIYRALVNESPPATITSGALIVGGRYTITTYVDDDDFLNVGADSNATGDVFIATGTTPASYDSGSTLNFDGAPIATVLENTIGAIVWTRDNAGIYRFTLTGAFTANKTLVFISLDAEAGNAYTLILENHAPNFYQLIARDDAFVEVEMDGDNASIEILVYP